MSELFEKSIRTLELPAVLEQLAAQAVSDEAKDRSRRLFPSTDYDDVCRLQDETEAARGMLGIQGSPNFSGLKRVAEILARADRGGVLNTRELLTVAGMLRCARRVKEYFNTDSAGRTVIDHMFDAGEQQRILEQIRQQRIEENLQYAYQNNPEGFVPYSLLFIECKINNKPVKAMIDTGAQVSILPFSIAKDCEVDYLIDRRWQTVTVGVGVQRSVGRIHALQVQVQNRVWANPFVVLDKGPLDHCILGVDWLTKNQAVIRLADRTLTVGDVVTPFLQPHE